MTSESRMFSVHQNVLNGRSGPRVKRHYRAFDPYASATVLNQTQFMSFVLEQRAPYQRSSLHHSDGVVRLSAHPPNSILFPVCQPVARRYPRRGDSLAVPGRDGGQRATSDAYKRYLDQLQSRGDSESDLGSGKKQVESPRRSSGAGAELKKRKK